MSACIILSESVQVHCFHVFVHLPFEFFLLQVTDCGNHRVQGFTLAAQQGCLCFAEEAATSFKLQLGQTGSSGSSPAHFNRPRGVVEYDGRVFVADCDNNRVQVFEAATGKRIHTIGGVSGSNDGELSEPKGITIDTKRGLLYVCEFGNKRVSVFNAKNYRFHSLFAREGMNEGELSYPVGVTVDSSRGLAYVTDSELKRVQVWQAAK